MPTVGASRQSSGGACFVVLGSIALIISCIYIVKPAMRGMSFTGTTCTVVDRILGEDSTHTCTCGPYCQSNAPCVRVLVTFPGALNSSLFHFTISDLMHFPVCTINNMNCLVSAAANVQAAQTFLFNNLLANSSFGCYHDGADVVGDVEYSKRDIVFAILWPSLLILFGLCMCSAGEGKSVGATILIAPFLLIILIVGFIVGACKAVYKFIRAKCCPSLSRAEGGGEREGRDGRREGGEGRQGEDGRVDMSSVFRRHRTPPDQPPTYDDVTTEEDFPPPIDAPFLPLLPLSSFPPSSSSLSPPPPLPTSPSSSLPPAPLSSLSLEEAPPVYSTNA